MTDDGSPGRRTAVRLDGGEDEEEFDTRRGGFLARLFPGRDERIRALRRQLQQAEREKDELTEQVETLQSRIDELERETEELQSTNAGYEQRQFTVEALLESVGRSVEQANSALRTEHVAVGDLDVTIRADVSGGGQRDSLALRLVDPDEEIDADRLSSLSFTVGGRGRFRHYGQPGAEGAGGIEPFMTHTPFVEDETDAEGEPRVTGGSPPSGPPVEMPNVNGLPVADAEGELREVGFEVHREYRPDEKPAGAVVEQWPRAFAVAPRGSSVVLFVGGTEGG
ncbi:PASTA domain-containing protein [Salinigranum sp. GCM10025319]|uniref:PASTA domain-containing protein n=1 Tax=Salinigranum sp. GCM10025319 TaxID=3252687 RepID=UPI003621A9CC